MLSSSDTPNGEVLMIQVMHRHVVDVCRPDGDTWAQRREAHLSKPFEDILSGAGLRHALPDERGVDVELRHVP